MKRRIHNRHTANGNAVNRRDVLGAVAVTGAALATSLGSSAIRAQTKQQPTREDNAMSQKAFVYTELQISVPFASVPWQEISAAIKQQPGFISKTWLAGVGNNSVGGFYSFDSIENAQKFVTGYFPGEAKSLDAAHNTRVFDATLVKEASLGLSSPHFDVKLDKKPGAFVYTEVQISVPFQKAPWADRNPVLKQQPGLVAKTWLSGLHTNTLGGLDAFDTLENAKAFALESFPKTAAKMNAAFYTRVFDANATEEASRFLNSPYYG